MTPEKLIKAGIKPETIAEHEINATHLVLMEEFHRKVDPANYGKDCHRKRTIERLIDMAIPFATDCNITTEMVKMFITVACPYCRDGRKLNYSGMTGSGTEQTITYSCETCSAKVSLHMPAEGGVSVTPPK